jgi:hypothetical protein
VPVVLNQETVVPTVDGHVRACWVRGTRVLLLRARICLRGSGHTRLRSRRRRLAAGSRQRRLHGLELVHQSLVLFLLDGLQAARCRHHRRRRRMLL